MASIQTHSRHLLPLATGLALCLAGAPVWADPPPHARGKGPPAHAGGPHHAKAPPPGWVRQAWRKGDRLPVHELDGYWIDDYGRIGLDAPPRGHRWVRQNDGRYLLVALATGLVVDMLLR
ncbi:RcnB family protein [Luteimonas kalidii]|uniref:RcnB family protein n=1 Tax=Luteimonas kalidii TaxID=3042025 RepID=A0ABT6JUG9_9GAMM|nr:RcnB family protein [Luteimonas kalidii]MDH5834339.1 RcnB family protein [Luteimonas kalidii]